MNKVKNHKEVKKAFDGINRNELAKTLKVSINYLNQVIDGFKQVSALRAVEWDKHGIPKEVLRPDVFERG